MSNQFFKLTLCLLILCSVGMLGGCRASSDQGKRHVIPIEANKRYTHPGFRFDVQDERGNIVSTIELPPQYSDTRHALAQAKVYSNQTAIITGQKIKMLLDTGAENTCIFVHPGWFAQYGIKPDTTIAGVGGMLGAKRFNISTLILGSVTLSNVPAVIIEQGDLTRQQFGGVIGADILFNYRCTFDYKDRKLILTEYRP